jgi:alanine-glyoxylate transaminase/serine-glyoxylate transaminase/serine-pyruvate transaminase
VFQTQNNITFPISASGTGGIETAMVNVLEPGDEAIVCVNGTFSARMAEIAERTGAKIHRVLAPLGRTVDPDDVRRAGQGRKIKFVGLAHGETSTGVVSNLDLFRKVADELGALLVVDSVATLAGVPLNVDRQRVDICFSGTQKAISAPPGMAPITVNSRVEEMLRARKSKVQSWYFDLTSVMNYWGKERTYHHTPPIPLIYALHEALRVVLEEGLEASWERHRQNQGALIAGLEAMGIRLFVENPEDRLPTVTSVWIPAGIDSVKARGRLLNEFNIEIAGGLGEIKSTTWRIGLMGYSSQRANVLLFLDCLERVLLDQGMKLSVGAGIAAAASSFAHAEPVTVGQLK